MNARTSNICNLLTFPARVRECGKGFFLFFFPKRMGSREGAGEQLALSLDEAAWLVTGGEKRKTHSREPTPGRSWINYFERLLF